MTDWGVTDWDELTQQANPLVWVDDPLGDEVCIYNRDNDAEFIVSNVTMEIEE